MDKIRILAIGTSSNRRSINLDLATYAAGLIEGSEVETLSVSDYELPLFSDAREKELGTPDLAQQFLERIAAADAIVPSFAEYNGSYTASFKNIFDWASRIDKRVFQSKPAVFLSTSPGARGAQSVLQQALQSAEHYGAQVVASLSVPKFGQSYDEKNGELKEGPLRSSLFTAMETLRIEIIRRRMQQVQHETEVEGSVAIRTGRSKEKNYERSV